MILKLVSVSLLFLVGACSSDKDLVRGYNGPKFVKAQNNIAGKSPKETLKYLGSPAVQGICKRCAPPGGLYRMIYLTQDMRRFYLELSYNTDQSIECLVFDFYPDAKLKRYVFDSKKGIKKEKNCNRKGGAILELQKIMDEEEKEASQKKK